MMDVKTVEKNVATQTIEKRDGRVQKYDPAKIKYALIQAVQKSKLSYANETIEEIADEVDEMIQENEPTRVDTSLIDGYVLKRLHAHEMNDLADSYVQRRKEKAEKRKNSRDINRKDRKSTRLNSSHVAISYAV